MGCNRNIEVLGPRIKREGKEKKIEFFPKYGEVTQRMVDITHSMSCKFARDCENV